MAENSNDGAKQYGPVAGPNGDVIMQGRIKDADALRGLFDYLAKADLWSSLDRAQVQAAIDGVPPADTARLVEQGRAYEANFNNGRMLEAQFAAESPYNEVLEAMDPICTLPTSYGTPDQQAEWEPKMEEHLTTLYKVGWKDFYVKWQRLARLITSDGMGFAYFQDMMDFRWKVDGLQYFKTFRRIEIGAENFWVICAKDRQLPHELFEKIRNREAAEAAGWNVDATWKAIKSACPKALSTYDYEEWQQAWKGNDLYLSGTADSIDLIFGWIQEVNGTISLLMGPWTGGNDFLYKNEGMYDSWDQFMQCFMYGVGSDGMFHSVRGQGSALFSLCDASSRLDCRLLDMSIFAATPHLQPDTEDKVSESAMIPIGPFDCIRPGWTFIETKAPDFEASLMPAVNRIDQLIAARRSQWSGVVNQNLADQGKTPKTKYQLMQEGQQSSALSTAGMNLFFPTMERLIRESVRRIIRRDYLTSDPGGREVWEFYKNCVEDGVPMEAIWGIKLDKIRINTGIGRGSAQGRTATLEEVQQTGLYNRADVAGQYWYDQQLAVSLLGPRAGYQMFPRKAGLRPPIDLQIAELENNQLLQGQSVTPIINQDHAVHVETHLAKELEINQSYTAGQLDLATAAQQMQPLQTHADLHMQMWASKGGEADPRFPQYKQALQQLDEVVTNGMKHVLKFQEEQGQQTGVPAGSPAGEVSPANAFEQSVDANAKLADLHFQTAQNEQNLTAHQQDIANIAEKHQMEIAHMKEKQAVEIAGKKANATLNIQSKVLSEKAKEAAKKVQPIKNKTLSK